MARPKEFERDEALGAALEVFWERGYQGTSMQDLVDAMGIGRASLYDTFGSKHRLFLEAMERYEQEMELRLAALERPGKARTLLPEFFRSLLSCYTADGCRNCLVVKSALVLGRDSETASRVARITARADEAFYRLLVRARREGEITPGRNLKRLARFLTHTMQGLAVSASIREDPGELKGIVRTALAVLDGPEGGA